MPKLADRVKETTTSTGTGAISLGGASVGYRAFSAAFSTGDSVYYAIEGGAEWEVGIGTLSSGTPWTLARTTILASSNAGAAVNFSAGTKNVFCTRPANTGAWACLVGGTGTDDIRACAATADGGFVTAANSGLYIHLVKFTAAGLIDWQRLIVAASASDDIDICIDGSGNIFILTFGGTYDYICKVSSAGALLAQKTITLAVGSYAYGLGADASGNVFLTGAHNNGSNFDVYLTKLDSALALAWSRRLYAANAERGNGLCIDGSGNACIVGKGGGTYDYPLIAQYDTSGNLVWQRKLSTTANWVFNKVAVDWSNNLYACGSGAGNGVVAKYSNAGALQWQRLITGTAPTDIAVASGLLFVVGGKYLFGISDAGDIVFQRQFMFKGAAATLRSVTVNSVGNVIVAGNVRNGVDTDEFVAQVFADGALGRGFPGGMSITESSLTFGAASLTDAADTLTSASLSPTLSTSSFADSAATKTQTIYAEML